MLDWAAMRCGRWLPLKEALLAIPMGPGLFQLRVTTGLLVFPGGRSAMVAYGGGEDLPAALQTFLSGPAGARAGALGPLLCRFGAPDGHRSGFLSFQEEVR